MRRCSAGCTPVSSPAQGPASTQTLGWPLPCRLTRCRSATLSAPMAYPGQDASPRSQHHVLHIVTPVARGAGHPTHDFPVTAVQRERDPELIAIVTVHLEAIRVSVGIAGRHGGTDLVPSETLDCFTRQRNSKPCCFMTRLTRLALTGRMKEMGSAQATLRLSAHPCPATP